MSAVYFTFLRFAWILIDFFTAKDDNTWAFPTHPIRSGEFIESPLAVFDCVKSDKSVRKLIFYRGALAEHDLDDATNYEFIKHGTWRGLLLLARCKVVFITNSISMEYSFRWGKREFRILPLSPRNRLIVNLSHGVSIKRLMYVSSRAMQTHHDRAAYRELERRSYAGLVATSDADSYVMASMYYPLNHHQIWLTGSPRNDFLVRDEARLPAYIRTSLERVRRQVRGRRLVLYAPTYRQTSQSATAYYYQFSEAEIAKLRGVLMARDAVLGYRPHYFRNSSEYFNMSDYVDGDIILDLSQTVVPDISALIRECEMVITDYSSVYTEALYLGKPGLCFAYDVEEYNRYQDGLLYDPELIFPGRVYHDFDALLGGLDRCLLEPIIVDPSHPTRRLFFKFNDDGNSARLCERVRQELRDM